MNYAGAFKAKRVIVTGAAGIHGGWIAAAFAREGAELCLTDFRRDKLDTVAADLGLDPANTMLHGCDLTSSAEIEAFARVIGKEWGAPDIVINNAGVYPRTGILINLEDSEFDRIMAEKILHQKKEVEDLKISHSKRSNCVTYYYLLQFMAKHE